MSEEGVHLPHGEHHASAEANDFSAGLGLLTARLAYFAH
jgi:hypothetical protein